MALPRPGEEDGMSFMRAHGGAFGTTQVEITPRPIKPDREVQTVEAVVQPSTIFVDVDTPVYDGDRLGWDDPRGGRQQAFVKTVKVYNQGSRSVRHSEIKYSTKAPNTAVPAAHGHTVINVHGSQNVNIGLGGSSITQQISVSPGYEKLAEDVGKALAVIEETAGVDPDEVDAAGESVTLNDTSVVEQRRLGSQIITTAELLALSVTLDYPRRRRWTRTCPVPHATRTRSGPWRLRGVFDLMTGAGADRGPRGGCGVSRIVVVSAFDASVMEQ